MATKKDLVEAYTFSKRRLVTAFISGAPGGREVEPVKPGRVLIGGIALSLLLLAGAAIAGFLIGRPNSQWLSAGSFVTSKDTGEQYVVLEGGDEPVIRRVPNYISAQLLLGKSDLTPYQVRDKYIRQVTLGEDLGIDDAPAGLPDPSGLLQSGWTACTASGTGIKVTIDETPRAEMQENVAFLVSNGPTTWLVAADGPDGRTYRFEIPADPVEAGTMAGRLGFGSIERAAQVSQEWLNLFPEGGALNRESFGLERPGSPTNYGESSATDLSRYRVGDLVLTADNRYYLLADDAPQELDEFAAMVYSAGTGEPKPLDSSMRAQAELGEFPEEWPARLPEADVSSDLCAVLHTDPDDPARVQLADAPDEGASGADIDAGTHDVEVQPSGGAYVRSGADDASDDGSPYVIDAAGYKYPLVGPEVPEYIGYGSTDAPLVPNAWMDFFADKVSLSVNLARRVPEDAPATDTDEES